MASPATVSMFVDCNPIRWQTRSLSEYAAEGMASEFYVKVVNTSGATHTYELRGMPEWLRADKPVGMIDPEGEVEIMFTIDKGLNVGMYDEVIYVVDENNLYEPLLLAVEVEGEEPQWFVWPSQKQYSMNIVGSVSINDVVITDPKDLVGVFDQTGRCMGVSNVSYDPQTAQSMLYLTVYDSTAVESQLYFKLWHHQTGKTLLLTTTPDTITFAPGQVRGTVKDPIAMKAGDSYIQKLQLDSGWNWISLNVYNNDFRNIDKLLKGFPWQNGDILTDDSDGLTLIYKNGSWLTNREGSLGKVSIKPSLGYRIKVQNDITIEIAGNSLKQKNMRRITVKPGWNGIGYTPMVNLDIETALADYYSYAQDGDVIKSQDEFAMFTKGAYDKGEWSGSLKYLHPGDGYMLKRMGTDTVQFYYPYHEPGYTFAAADMRAPRHTPSHAHAATMNVAAAIEGISLCQGDSLIALADGQVCGQAACTDDVVYLSIGGDKKAPLRFAILRDGQLMAVTSEQLMFQPDHVSGSPSEPTVIRFLRNADTTPSEGWHTLQGLRLPDKPARQGVYIHNGKTVIRR
jgi:hypothetical protein